MASLSHSFSGKQVLVTGGGRGIGESIVRKFYNDGAIVFVLDKSQSLLDKLKADLPNIHPICVDLMNWKETQEAVLSITPIDHLVNNAGIFDGGPVVRITEEALDRVLGVNLKALICVTQAFVNGNVKAGKEKGTTIVHISSIADRVGMWGAIAYCAAKAGVTSITKTMALEFGEMNIRVNCVCPTFIATHMVSSCDPDILGKVTLMGRVLLKDRELQTPDVADSVLFLSSPLSSMVTGTSIVLDAGTLAH